MLCTQNIFFAQVPFWLLGHRYVAISMNYKAHFGTEEIYNSQARVNTILHILREVVYVFIHSSIKTHYTLMVMVVPVPLGNPVFLMHVMQYKNKEER